MPIFNQTKKIAAPLNVVSAAIEDSVAAGDRFMAVKPPALLIVLRGEWGYVYLLRGDGEATTVRLVVDTVGEVRHAFRGRSHKEAIEALLKSPGQADPEESKTARDAANLALLLLKRRCEHPDERFQLVQSIEKAEDAAAAPGSKIKRAKPWNPALLFLPSMLTSWFLGGYLYGLNWRKFGKTGWMWGTLGITVLLHSLIALVGYISLTTDPRPWDLVGAMIGLSLCNMLLVLTLNSLQNGAYKYWKTGRDVLQFRYHILRTVLAYLLMIAIVVGGAGGYLYYENLPESFSTEYVTLTYSADWAQGDTRSQPICERAQAFLKCQILLIEAETGELQVLIARIDPAQPMTASRLNEVMKVEQEGLTGQSLDRDLDGLRTASHIYKRPAPETEAGSIYGLTLFVAQGPIAYMVTVESPTEAMFRASYSLLDELLETLEFNWDGA